MAKLVDQFVENQIVSERYKVVSLIGEGGMGLVYRVVQIYLGKEFAFKTIKKSALSDLIVRRFQQEARAAFALKHENIIGVNDFGVLEDDTPYLVMELVNGETLGQRMKRAGRLTLEQALPIFLQVCNGLSFAHKHGVVHRDMKPTNIMLIAGGSPGDPPTVKIVDFGIAKFAGHEEGEIQALTRTGEIFGSPLYMSPEQCLGSRIDNRSDIYSLGCVFFECLTGLPPFVGENALSTMMKHQGSAQPTLKEASLGFSFSPQLEDIIKRMLAKTPEQRYQSLEDVATDFQALQSGAKISRSASAPQAVAVDGQFLTITKTKLLVLLAIVGIISMVAGGVLIYLLQPHKVESVAPVVSQKAEPKSDTGDVHDMPQAGMPDLFEHTTLSEKDLNIRLEHPEAAGCFHLGDRQVTRHVLERIYETSGIFKVVFSSCKIDQGGLNLLVKKKGLTELNVDNSDVTDSGAKSISSCKELTVLNVSRTLITDSGFKSLMKIPNLERLSANGLNLSDGALENPAPGLRYLAIKINKRITNAVISKLSRLKLVTLDLDETSVNDDGIKALPFKETLKKVGLSDTQVSASGISELCKSHPHLYRVDIKTGAALSQADLDDLKAKFGRQVEFHLHGKPKDEF